MSSAMQQGQQGQQGQVREVNNAFRHLCCPVCRGPAISAIGSLPYGPLASFGSAEVQLAHVPELWSCDACGSWFTQNAISPALARELYCEGQSDVKWPAQPLHLSKTPDLLQVLDGLLQGDARTVIDIGCNTGELLDYCAQRGARTYGLELSASSLETCLRKGHQMLSSLEETGSIADLVFAFDLVEHLHDLPSFLTEVHGVLRRGGRLVVLTGDNTSTAARHRRQRWWYLHYPEHIVFPSWHAWAQASGFRLVQRLRTYASTGYRVGPAARLKGLALLLLGRGNGMPLVCGDHQLLVLQKS